jgi:hypothetical protein
MADAQTPTTLATFNSILTGVNLLLPQVAGLITIGDAAIRALWGIWSARNPGKTFDEYIAELRADAQAVQLLAAEKLTERGFVQAADGTWYKPVA